MSPKTIKEDKKNATENENGTLSIHTENIFPIIKQFLYADQEVFLRELVSNAVDATQKLRQLANLGTYTDELKDLRIQIKLNPTAKTITISDMGIGMTRDEIKEYINQIAFSGAEAFIKKYEQADKEIIGHFGLGFYSSFMVARQVDIHTRSYLKEAEAIRWSCSGTTQFEITSDVKKNRGTDIVLHINEDALEYLKKERIRALLDKYCQFLPVEIDFEGEIINQPNPPWTKPPNTLEDKDYQALYRRLYPMAPEPLFWIHLHVDYPFELNGILYFPPLSQSHVNIEQHGIQLYARQVFITEDVKDVVPAFLQLLHGVIDSPDIPLNVSRSALQSDARVKKIHSHITKKVADKLTDFFKDSYDQYKEKWTDLGLFVRYGLCSDEKFYEKALPICLLQNNRNELFTLEDYRKKVAEQQTDKHKKLIFLYTTNPEDQHRLIQQAEARNYDVLRMDGPVDTHFIQHLETKETDIQWRRVDASGMDTLIDKGITRTHSMSDTQQDQLKQLFEKHIKDIHQISFPVKTEAAEATDPPLTLITPEFLRRMQEISVLSGQKASDAPAFEVLINTNHPLIIQLSVSTEDSVRQLLAHQLYDLALLAQHRLKGAALDAFIQQSFNLLESASPKESK